MDEALYNEMFRVEGQHWWFRAKHQIVACLLSRYLDPSIRHAAVADLGCGCGMMVAKLQDKYAVVGLDGSEQAARLARRRGLNILVGELPGPTPLEDAAFDAVLLLDVLEHLDDDSGTVHEAKRILKPGGILIATVPAHAWLWTRRDELHHHRRRYSFGQFKRLVSQPGFETLLVSYLNGLLFPLAVAERLYRKLRPVDDAGDLKIPPTPINETMRACFAVERHLLGRCPLPMGLSLAGVVRKQ
ncbi:MAG: class I SAM-dependent methyltransferase [Pirellulaceae bacterium]|nr:class I SAM-dependent methyltransferase [Pirellulaceae bacterium]